MTATGHSARLGAAQVPTTGANLILDETGQAQVNSDRDPAAGGTRLDYLLTGAEPAGVIRAAIECCAELGIATTALEVRLRTIRSLASNSLWPACIRVGLGLALASPDGLDLAKLVDLLPRISTWGDPYAATADALAASVHSAEASRVFGALVVTDNEDKVIAHMHQAWMKYDSNQAANMIGKLSTSGLTVSTFAPHLSRKLVDPNLPGMLAIRGMPTRGQMLVALAIAVADTPPPPAVRQFLRAAAGGAASRSFPAALDVEQLLPGGDDVLSKIGPPAPAPTTTVDDLDGDGNNDAGIDADPHATVVTAKEAIVRDRASSSGNQLGTLANGEWLFVSGRTRDRAWSMIDFNGSVGFVDSRAVKE